MFAELSNLVSGLAEHSGEAFRSRLPGILFGAVGLIVVHLILAWRGRRGAVPKAPWNLWEKLVYLGTLASVGVLGVTAFYAVLRFGVLEGWLLFAHMFGAGAFVAVLPLLAITWCEASRFGRGRTSVAQPADAPAPRFFWFPKLMFWLLLASGLTVTLTMLLSMLPIFGTDDLHRLLDLHRYSGLVAVVVTVMHFYCVLLQRVGLR